MSVDFSFLRNTRQPTKREAKLYRRWVKYLSDSKLSESEIHSRAASFAEQGRTDYHD